MPRKKPVANLKSKATSIAASQQTRSVRSTRRNKTVQKPLQPEQKPEHQPEHQPEPKQVDTISQAVEENKAEPQPLADQIELADVIEEPTKEMIKEKRMTEEELVKWQALAIKLKNRLRVYFRSTDLPKPKVNEMNDQSGLPSSVAEVQNAESVTTAILREAEIYFQQRVARMIEGINFSDAELTQMIKQEFTACQFPDAVTESMLSDPEDMIRLIISKAENLPKRTLTALHLIEGIDASQISKNIWAVNRIELLEPHFNRADVKQCRKIRKSFLNKITLYVDLISAIEKDCVLMEFSDNDLKALHNKLMKVENDEIIQSLANLKRKAPPKAEKNKSNTGVRLKLDLEKSSEKSVTLSQMEASVVRQEEPKDEIRADEEVKQPAPAKATGLDRFLIRKIPSKAQLNEMQKPAGGQVTVAAEKQKAFQSMEWTDAESLRRSLDQRAHQDRRDFYKMGGKEIKRKARRIRIINIMIWDSVLEYENYGFSLDRHCVNPRNPFQQNEAAINYDLDSEDELEELMGDDAANDADEYDSEYSRGPDIDGKGNNLELVNEGWLVPDDYVSDSSDEDLKPFENENEAEYELRCQQKRIERERKRKRHIFQKRVEDRLQSLFRLGKQMKPVITIEEAALNDYSAISLLKDKTLPIQISKENSNETEAAVSEPKKPAETIKDHFNEVVQHVHGSSLNKAQLEKELIEKLPKVTRKSIKLFLSTYCERAHDVDVNNTPLEETKQRQSNSKKRSQQRPRQMINVEKILQDDLVQPEDGETGQQQSDLKRRVSRQLDDILSARRQKEVVVVTAGIMGDKPDDTVTDQTDEWVAEQAKTIAITNDCEVYADQQLFQLLEIGEESKQSVIPFSQPLQNRTFSNDVPEISQPRQSQLRSSLRKPSRSKNVAGGSSSKVRFSGHVQGQIPFQFVSLPARMKAAGLAENSQEEESKQQSLDK